MAGKRRRWCQKGRRNTYIKTTFSAQWSVGYLLSQPSGFRVVPLPARHPHKPSKLLHQPTTITHNAFSDRPAYRHHTTGCGFFPFKIKIYKLWGELFQNSPEKREPVAKPKATHNTQFPVHMMDWHKTFLVLRCSKCMNMVASPPSLSGAQTTFLGYRKGNIRRELQTAKLFGLVLDVAVWLSYSPLASIPLFLLTPSTGFPSAKTPLTIPTLHEKPAGVSLLSLSVRCTHTIHYTQTVPFNRLGADGWGMC